MNENNLTVPVPEGRRHRFLRDVLIFFLALLGLLAVAVAVKAVWVRRCCREIGSFESERTDILERRAYLAREILVEPDALIERCLLRSDIVPVGEAIALAMRTALPSPD